MHNQYRPLGDCTHQCDITLRLTGAILSDTNVLLLKPLLFLKEISCKIHVQTMEALTKTSQSLTQVRFFASGTTSSTSVDSSKMYTPSERELDVAYRSCYSKLFVCNVILHPCFWVNLKLYWLHWWS